jgi:hypothetical protein
LAGSFLKYRFPKSTQPVKVKGFNKNLNNVIPDELKNTEILHAPSFEK